MFLSLFCLFVSTKTKNQCFKKLLVSSQKIFRFFSFWCLFFIRFSFLDLHQNHAKFNKLLQRNFLTCYSCWFTLPWTQIRKKFDTLSLVRYQITIQLLFHVINSYNDWSTHRGCSVKNVFLEILQNSHENTCARVSFLSKSVFLWIFKNF